MGKGSKGRVRSGSPGALAAELSAVINRVRRAFGPIPMADFADRPEILQAARQVNRVAWRRMRGEAGTAAWQQALSQYEARWLQELGEGRANRAA